MAKHLNPLEKEFLIRKFKGNSKVKLSDFCRANNVSETSFKKWLKQYEEAGIEGLARADAEIVNILPEGIDKTKEGYKREILRLRIENERLKKKYVASFRIGRLEDCSFQKRDQVCLSCIFQICS